MKRILYTSSDVRQAIVGLFENPRKRRIAITAFVGEGAEAYLPNPKGLQLYCWPKAGGTDPQTLRNLIERGADVFFVDRLHMKVYWAQDRGAVVTSANLSTNALGSGDLREMGILLAPSDLDIGRILQSLKSRPASAAELRRLDNLHKQYKVRNKEKFARRKVQSYGEWYKSPFRQQWKLGVLTDYVNLANGARRKSKEEYRVSEPKNWLSSQCGDYKEGDWILTFWVKRSRPVKLEWFSVDYFVKVSPSEKVYDKETPCQYVQVWSRNRYPPPPFKLDESFREVLGRTIQDVGPSRIDRLTKVSKRIVDLIYENWH